jgi:MFS family permease
MEIKYPKYRWFACITMIVITLAQGMILIAPSPIVQPISEALGVSLGEVSAMLLVTFTLCVAVFGVIGGIIVDKIGLPLTYVFSAILMALGSVLIIAAGNTVPLIILGRIISGAGAGPVVATAAKLAADWFPVNRRAIVAGLSGGSMSVGITLGLNMSPQVFAGSGDWNQAVAFCGVVTIPALILSLVFFKGPKPPAREALVIEGADFNASESLFKTAVKQPAFYVGIIGAFALSWVMNAYNDLTPGNVAVDVPVGLGYGPVVAGQIMGIYSLAFMVGCFVCGFIMHGVFKDRARIFIPIAFILTAIFCASVLVPGISGNQNALLVCLILAGFFMGMPQASIQAFVAINYPESIQGRIGGLTMGLGIIGAPVGVAVGAAALHMSGAYRLSVVIAVVFAIIGAIGTLWLKPPSGFKAAK